MSDELKITFQLTAHAGRELEVRLSAPGGETKGETRLPPKDALDELALADPARLPVVLVEKLGEALYRTLACEAVDELVVDTLNDAIRAGQPAQFELRFDPDQVDLARYPWEMIRNAQGQFLVRDGLVDLTRYITYPQPPPSFDASMQGLPLFRLVSQPPTLPPITAIDLKFKPQETLPHATFEGFTRRLLIDRLALWGLQFDGHGALAFQCPKCDALSGPDALTCRSCGESLKGAKRIGALAFEKNGDVSWVPTGEFGAVLYNAHVRLAMLLACETACVGNALVFSGLAPGLLLAGVPAVIGMQFPVRDDFANSFANEFYTALVKNNDLLAALRIARRMNMLGAWYSPALYLRHKPGIDEEKAGPAYLRRNIDTAAPTRAQPGVDFLARLWIRRPETKPLTVPQLREELNIPKEVPVRQDKGEAEVKFEPVLGRKLRRGEVEVQMASPACDVKPEGRVKLFIDETLDAPPAIFTARARQTGRVPLLFDVWQDGGKIHSVVHHIEVGRAGKMRSTTSPSPIDEFATHSHSVDVDGQESIGYGAGENVVRDVTPSKPLGDRKLSPEGSVYQPRPRIAPLGEARLVTDGGQAFQIVGGENRVGRAPDNDICLSGDQTISRWHAVIVRQEDGAVLQDLGSTGGTYVNGERVTTVYLQDGDEIQFGQDTRLRFYMEETQAAAPSPTPIDLEETLHHLPEVSDEAAEAAEELLEEPEPGDEGWLEEIDKLKDVVDKFEPGQEPAASADAGSIAEPPRGADSTVPASKSEVERRIEEARRRMLEDRERLQEAERTVKRQIEPPQLAQPAPSVPGDVGVYDEPPEALPKRVPRLQVVALGCVALAVIIGLIVASVLLLAKRPDPDLPPTTAPDIIRPDDDTSGDTLAPVIESVEHVPGALGYGEYCPDEERQFTIQARVSDDSGIGVVTLVYTFYAGTGEQVGDQRTVEMVEVRPGLYAATVPTNVALEEGYSSAEGEVRYIIIAIDTAGNQSDSGQPRAIPIHQCLG
ncbi:MAG: FHA domain-containing protein [Anaerolineae bacterium]|nr:FHA domain-containing protein [Anaerolineae bacterium]